MAERLLKIFTFTALVLVLVTAVTGGALAVEYEYTTVETGVLQPGDGSATPWLTAVFTDDTVNGDVDLTMTVTNLKASEFVSDWGFNLGGLNIPFTATQTDSSGATAAISYDASMVGKDYDLLFTFPTSNAGGGVARLKDGEVVAFSLAGSGLTASSFSGFTGAHIQGIPDTMGGTTSSVITTPEPVSAMLFLIGGGLLITRARRKLSGRA